MLFDRHTPGHPLALHIDYLWHLRDLPGHAAERVLPCGTLELVINLAHDTFSIQTRHGRQRRTGAMVSGAYQQFFTIDTRDHADVMGVHFRPGGAWPVLGIAPGALADQHCDLDQLWGADAGCLRERLIETPAQQRLTVLERLLAARCAGDWQLHAACAHALAALPRGERVADVAHAVGLSPRRLQTVFQEQVGTTPKLYARLCRFQRAFRGLESDAARHWPRLALAAGYCDQSHMIREFQAIAGWAPVQVSGAQDVAVKEHHLALPGCSDSSNTERSAGATCRT